MTKSIFKEIIIVLLLIIILVLLLGILFYDYMPNSKTIPTKVQEYVLEETVKQELDKELNNINSEEIIKTYKIDSIDIAGYEKTNQYDKGKINPFAQYSKDAEGVETNNSNTDDNENGNGNSAVDPSKDNFLGTTGK